MGCRMGRTDWAWTRLLGGAAILAALVWHLGAGPFVDGIEAIDGWTLAAALGIAFVTTASAARRWSLVARGLGIAVPMRTAVAAYYRSQFLNTTLPGGFVGDVHRGVVQGRGAGDVARGLRAVAWERSIGQLVQAGLAVIVLLALPPGSRAMPVLIGAVLVVALLGLVLLRVLPHRGQSRWAGALRAARCDLRDGVLARQVWPGIVTASVVVVAGQTAIFLIAAHSVGISASPDRMLPLAMLVLLAMSVPTNIGGWGPREGVAAWAFGAVGLGASQGLATAVVYGVLVLVASLPGAVVLFAQGRDRADQQPDRSGESLVRRPVAASSGGAARD
ncbi:MAG: lysylphosphatidylglycerol synthase transmembrane domain-containing protein [Pseudonocardiales bacterium]